ncbi:MAG: flagellar protein FlaG [bacterium]|nr:flagellar protein FlaG [bacterium]
MKIASLIDSMDSVKQFNAANEKKQEPVKVSPEKIDSEEPSTNDIMEVVDKLNLSANNFSERVLFSYNEKLNRVIVKIIDSETEEVVREIPPKAAMKLYEQIQEHLGLIFDESI